MAGMRRFNVFPAFAFNLKTGKALGLEVPDRLALADEVIESAQLMSAIGTKRTSGGLPANVRFRG